MCMWQTGVTSKILSLPLLPRIKTAKTSQLLINSNTALRSLESFGANAMVAAPPRVSLRSTSAAWYSGSLRIVSIPRRIAVSSMAFPFLIIERISERISTNLSASVPLHKAVPQKLICIE